MELINCSTIDLPGKIFKYRPNVRHVHTFNFEVMSVVTRDGATSGKFEIG